MQSLLLFDSDGQTFSVDVVQHIFDSVDGFANVRRDTPVGAPIEADYIVDQDSTMVELSPDRKVISLSGTTDAALRAALVLQSCLPRPLRIIDLDYSFDLALARFHNIDELRDAMNRAQPR